MGKKKKSKTSKYDLPLNKIKSDLVWNVLFALFAIAVVVLLRILRVGV